MFTTKNFSLVVATLVVALAFCGAAFAAQTSAPAKTTDTAAALEPFAGKTAGDVMDTDKAGKDSDKNGAGDVVPGLPAVLHMLFWVVVVIALIYGAVYLLRKYVPSARNMFGGGVMKVVSKTYVSSKQSILLVKVGGKFVLVGVTGTSMTPLSEVGDPEEVKKISEELASQGGSFSDSFKKAMSRTSGETTSRDEEVSGIREEVDEVRKKVNWWRRQSKS